MSGELRQLFMGRRAFFSRLGAGVGILGAMAIGSSEATARGSEAAPWRPTRDAQDDWYDKIPGQHRFVFDTTTPDGMASALRFATNYYVANQTAYGVKDSDLAVVIIARHESTPFGYNDAIWAKYGKQLSAHADFVDPKTKEAPKVNVYTAAADASDHDGGPINLLVKKGAQFAVCRMASQAMAEIIAHASGGDADAILKEISANLIPNARFVPAGIVAVNRAQERGYSLAVAT